MKLYCPQCQQRFDGELEVCPDDGSRLFLLDSPQAAPDPLLGQVIDERFRIERLLGVGGMGAVYAGVQLSVNREVAIKVLRPEMSDREKALERFFREAKVVSELSHANIVSLFDFGQDRSRDLLYLVMELVRGIGLGELLEQGRLRVNMALEVVYQVCGALTEPHARGIIHRDLKPDNLVLLPVSDGTVQVKVLDFGIARALEQSTQITKTGMICGTPAYMAPEQAQNHAIDGRTDLYALGVILFEMLSGMVPFSGETSLQILFSHLQKSPPSLRHLVGVGSLPEDVEALCYRLLAKAPEERPASAREVRDEIDQLRMRHQLRPVRLDAGRAGVEAFEGWLMPHLDTDRRAAPSSTQAQRQRQTPQTGGFGAVPGTDEFESMPTRLMRTPAEQEPVRVGAEGEADTLPEFGGAPRGPELKSARRDTITGESQVDVQVARIRGPLATMPVDLEEPAGRRRTGLVAAVAVVAVLGAGGAVWLMGDKGGEPAGAPVNSPALVEVEATPPELERAPEVEGDFHIHARSAGAEAGAEAVLKVRELTATQAALARVAAERQAAQERSERERVREAAARRKARREARAQDEAPAGADEPTGEDAVQNAAQVRDKGNQTDSALRERLRRLRSGE
ncbi:hypothetical protein DL240_09290 [Lujinxingia litoralis]|uniref:non-specific serine/threonine protein kinase n=1 Tax=Lujinxingia litoralis TaxID=2211119 RepID=A0A328C6C8_9DELT|nr:serine/threonine-protein kinase [Lujinxingia litoralis]RAL23069.1 hypothetical protein DL240_09290 [Lujinxingia litoralis]